MMRILLALAGAILITNSTTADRMLGLPSLTIPKDNPQTLEKIALGKAFFHDVRFSADGTISCAGCHRPEKGFSDGLTVAQGLKGQRGLRNTPTIINAAFYRTLFVDGRAADLEKQALGPLLNPLEHGLRSETDILTVIKKDEDYQRRIMQVFAIDESQITAEHVARAIASFERTVVAGDSAFDRYYFGRDRSQLSDSAARGLLIFRRKGNCANCHEISMAHALFSDNRSYNTGVGSKELEGVIADFISAIRNGADPDRYTLTDRQRSELGRFNVTRAIDDIGRFKTPSLRNVALTAPYMHDGSMKTLEAVVDYYDKGGDKNRFLDPA
ncbi:MAG: cytochrome-c peroxidase, partial [Gammaproteobacteria bacterium]